MKKRMKLDTFSVQSFVTGHQQSRIRAGARTDYPCGRSERTYCTPDISDGGDTQDNTLYCYTPVCP